MDLPMIELASLPALETTTALFGSLKAASAGVDDTVVAIMVYVYEVTRPAP
ncbi:hypothetical protein P7228_00640 [Altererythrobacter arenosus]|uniref:Uncharacterized protein n=1 Tax=Altererythrobacter arenosus TaxID=3032592 RepID=A0ABY8FRG1_9SPHN|nr:hypothetical protein [Altererythrobacter sp. CAU 1644]WFL77604.1 hypothetical protein P7228_00640 [Altererythrobacter sp. CAU 1644]